MRSQAIPVNLGLVLLALFATDSALAEPPAIVPYVNEKTGECGLFREGFRDEERTPLNRDFAPIRFARSDDECKSILDKVLAYPEVLRTPAMGFATEAPSRRPCQRLAASLPASPEHTCRALGYRYVGELPASIRPCYPNLAPLLGARCAPLVWIHLSLVIVAFAIAGALGYVVIQRRGRRRRAMAAAARGEAGTP